MPTNLAELARLVEGDPCGDADTLLSGVSSIASATQATIVFAENPAALEAALLSPAGAVITKADPGANHDSGVDSGEKPGILVANPRLAFARIAAFLHPPVRPAPRKRESRSRNGPGSPVEGGRVSRALKSQKLWLSLTYVGLILLMARTYA